jgi:cytochrome o ubiquinol oxidase operon protein cyoD
MENASPEASRGTLWTYITGYVLSLELTLAAYFFVKHHISLTTAYSHDKLIAVIIVLAISQLFVQLLFFLHLSKESRPRWNLIVLLFAAMVLLIVVLGSLWIMNNLNYHHPTQDQINKYIRSQGDI